VFRGSESILGTLHLELRRYDGALGAPEGLQEIRPNRCGPGLGLDGLDLRRESVPPLVSPVERLLRRVQPLVDASNGILGPVRK